MRSFPPNNDSLSNSLKFRVFRRLRNLESKEEKENKESVVTLNKSQTFSRIFFQYVPQELAHDIYCIYFEKLNNLKIDLDKNPYHYSIITGVYNNIIANSTRYDSLKTLLYTKNILYYLFLILSDSYRDKNSPIDLSNLSDVNKTYLDELDAVSMLVPGTLRGDFSQAVKMAENASLIQDINLSKSTINSLFKTLIKYSDGFFGKQSSYDYESLLEGSGLGDEILDLHYLIPPLNKVNLLDIETVDIQYSRKLDIYIDCSSSMSFNNRDILAKVVAIKLLNMGYIRHIYFFNGYVDKKPYTDISSILKYQSNGGTSFDQVIKHSINNNISGIIITDGESSLNYYKEDIFFINICGDGFDSFRRNKKIGHKYLNNRQCTYYHRGSETLNRATLNKNY